MKYLNNIKLANVVSETILPNTIAIGLFISYFFIKDRLAIDPDLESCERYELSAVVYLIFALGGILISILYDLIVGSWILKRKGNKILLNIINSMVFGSVFPILFIAMEDYNRKENNVRFYCIFFVAMMLLGVLISVLKSAFRKLWQNEY